MPVSRLGFVLSVGTLCLAYGGSGPTIAAPKLESNMFGEMAARSIGPAVMGGRIAAMDAVYVDRRLTVYVGGATGGVWKSINGGTTFKPVFEDHTQSIGAVAIDRGNPSTVWAGTGESWVRNSVSIGDGIYKTVNGGDKWEHLGLKDTERIVKILIHPARSDTVYICAPGHLWNANEERGVFKTIDGGKTWEKILYIDADTGCGDLAMDPQEPDVLYAGMWQFRRWPWHFTSGGPGSGLYKTTDGGSSWRKLANGIPGEDLGRIAVAVAPSRPNRVYATIESESTALYRSDNCGETWVRAGTTAMVEARPFYFSLLLVDPKDHNRVYKPATFMAVSNDAGETFTMTGSSAHPDQHAVWIDPESPDRQLLGTDGGLYESVDRGVHWTFRQSLPLSQFYAVSFDMEDPYNVYGGLQDNGSWMGPSRTASGIRNAHWRNIGGGDGFHVYVDRSDADFVYTEWQGGRIQRYRRSTGETKDIKPLEGEGDPAYRFNWNSPIHVSPNRPDTIYLGGQFVFRSRDRGESWEKISPDLTTNDPEKQKQMESGGLTIDNSTAENHCTLYTIAESPLDENVIWAGTDDGNVQVSSDGGRTWINVTSNIPGVPACTWVTQIDPSPHDKATAYVTMDGHRTGDRKPYMLRTTDLGQNWNSLVTDEIEGYCLSFRQDIVRPELLFLGTEFGLYVSIDDGKHWARFKNKLPKVGVRAIAIHPREHDLILGTHGRGIIIIDDITPLRGLTTDFLESEVAFLPTRPAQMRIPAGSQEFTGDDEFIGSNPPDGAAITYYLKKRHLFGDLRVQVFDTEGNLVSELSGGRRAGINRVSWAMRGKAPKVAPAATLVPQMFSMLGPQVAEGAYRVRLVKGDQSFEGSVNTVMDPRADYTAEDLALQDKVVHQLYAMLERLTYVVDAILAVQEQAKSRKSALTNNRILGDEAQRLHDDLEGFRKTLVATRKGGFIAGEEQLREKLGQLYGAVNGYEGRPTDSQVTFMSVLDGRLRVAERQLDETFKQRLDELNDKLRTAGVEPLPMMTREQWQAKRDSE
jgi:photosystem II stability/assembly factor-like uncharacterized protein